MNKVYVLPPKEDWICDRIVEEWYTGNADISVHHPKDADVVWVYSDWCWRGIADAGFLRGKKVLTTIHHIVPEKFGIHELDDFRARDLVTTAYHVYNEHTFGFIRPLTERPIHLVNYWANQHKWHRTQPREETRARFCQTFNVLPGAYLIGSFQRDTEGSDLKSPKREKGPDIFCDYVQQLHKEALQWAPHVILAGWRRQYVIGRLEAAGVPYTYFEHATPEVINDLYSILDLYPVTSRCEGGPQALIECGLLGVPVISRSVGIAEQVLPPSAINNDVRSAVPAVPNVENWKLPAGFKPYRDLIQSF